jgi:putative intracellular protease/amidase
MTALGHMCKSLSCGYTSYDISWSALIRRAVSSDFDPVYVSGGHGPTEDLADNPVIGRIFAALYPDKHKAVAAVCHGVGALLLARDARPRQSSPTSPARRLTEPEPRNRSRRGMNRAPDRL